LDWDEFEDAREEFVRWINAHTTGFRYCPFCGGEIPAEPKATGNGDTDKS
jgi:hypothetical protein